MSKLYYITYIVSFLALIISIKLPTGGYFGEIFLKDYYNKLAVAGIFLLSYYFSLKSVNQVKKRHYQFYIFIASALIFISLVTNLFW